MSGGSDVGGPAISTGMDRATGLRMHETMVRIRVFETRVEQLFLEGSIPGFVHLYIGQEAVAAGVCAALDESDYITSTHRGHGHAIAKGVALNGMMAELFGKATGLCRGRGGSMHVADFGRGMLGANGIVAGGLGIAAGAALASTRRGEGRVAVAFFGDGGINKGSFHEALNFAALHRLPVVYVCENNQYAQFTARTRSTSVDDLVQRADAYGIPGESVDGGDAGAVYLAARRAVDHARRGSGPTLLEAVTYRYGGHYVGDAEAYREEAEVEDHRSRDPIPRWEATARAAGWLTERERDEVWERVQAEVAASVAFARASPDPDPDGALEGVFT